MRLGNKVIVFKFYLFAYKYLSLHMVIASDFFLFFQIMLMWVRVHIRSSEGVTNTIHYCLSLPPKTTLFKVTRCFVK